VEIGCATGALLGLLKKAGQPKVIGLDPSPACCRIATETYGVATRCGTLSDNLIPEGSVDFLILIGVLEHLRDLAPAVAKFRTLLAPGGRIFITVPDASRYSAGDDAPFQEFSLEHINFFGPQSLSNLMAAHGFKTVHSEQAEIHPNFRTMTPVLHACFERLETVSTNPDLPFDQETVLGLKRYVERSLAENEAIQPCLEELTSSRRPVTVWGAGAHTLRLLATSALGRANLKAIVDSNPLYQGKSVNGVPILKPAALTELPGAILISTRVFQNEIHHQIVNGMKLKNEVITLYQITAPGN
jgi:SAM-dependent methyltransferase